VKASNAAAGSTRVRRLKRALFVVVYATVLVIICDLIAGGFPQRAGFVVVRSLPQNHRIGAGDIEAAAGYRRTLEPFGANAHDFEGRFLPAAVGAGRDIDLAATRSSPILLAPANAFALWLPLADVADVERGVVDAGSRVDVCGLASGTGKCLDDLPVAGIVCAAIDKDACFVGIWMAIAQRTAILGARNNASKSAGTPAVHILLRYPEKPH
jgi:hypothetical protein